MCVADNLNYVNLDNWIEPELIFIQRECVTDLDQQTKMIIFESHFTTFEADIIFWGAFFEEQKR